MRVTVALGDNVMTCLGGVETEAAHAPEAGATLV